MKLEDLFIGNTTDINIIDADGNDTGETITIFGFNSKEYRRAKHWGNTEIAKNRATIKTDEDSFELTERVSLHMLAKLIKGWTLEEEVTTENKIKLLENATHIREQIDSTAVNRRLFSKPAVTNSTSGRKEK